MIYEIKGIDITKLNLEHAFVIALSATGEFALISSSVVPSYLEIINTLEESEVTNLLAQDKWKQPQR
jgi:hypothetical protein